MFAMWYVGYGRYVGTVGYNRVAGVGDEQDVPDLVSSDIDEDQEDVQHLDNNPSLIQGLAGLEESICHVG